MIIWKSATYRLKKQSDKDEIAQYEGNNRKGWKEIKWHNLFVA